MQEEYLKKIVDSFQEQCRLYQQMLSLSAQQLEILINKTDNYTNGLHEIIAERSRLLESILQLTAVNKELQQQVSKGLEIEEFSLSNLKGYIAEEYYKQIKELINELGLLLEKINDNDKQSQVIMQSSLNNRETVIKTEQVENLYRKSMHNNSSEK